MSRKLGELVADFETTTTADDCRVWGYGIASVEDEPHITVGGGIEEFIEEISRKSCSVWFHNLGFDGGFIMDWLLKNGYEWTGDRPQRKQFSTLISMMGHHFQIQVKWENGVTTTFKDSLKRIPMSVKHIANAYKLPTPKGDIDYHTPRPVGHILTEEEKQYIRADVDIVARALHEQNRQGMSKLTVGADALEEFKQLVGKKRFSILYPVLGLDMDKVVRTAYRGGFTYADPRYKGKRVGPGQVLDVNSLYPYVMRHKSLPYGLPVEFDAYPPDDGSQYIVSVTFTGRLKPGHIPTIQAKKSLYYKPTEYLETIDEPLTLSVTNIDLALMFDHYDLEIESYNGGLAFRHTTGMFDKYVDKWSKVKETTEGGQREISKLFLNALYGKFATNPDVTGKYPVLEDNTVKLRATDEELRDPVYTALGVFITSYARDTTIRAAQQNYDSFAYADTDSLHLLTLDDPQGIEVDPHRLGAWKREYYFDEAVFLRAKQYGEVEPDGTKHIHIAACPRPVAEKLDLDDLYTGNVLHGKMQQKRVPGGIILQETTFTIKGD